MDYTNSEITRFITEHIHSERDRKILLRRLVDGIRYELMDTIRVIQPRLYDSVIRKIDGL